MNRTGTVHGRLTRETLRELIADSQSKETRQWLLSLLERSPDRLGYVISYPACFHGVVYEERAYKQGTCYKCKYYEAANFPPGTGECKWCGW